MIFLDIETSWFTKNKIIELAYIKEELFWEGSEERFEKRYWLEFGEKIELEAMAVHHITDAMIEWLPVFEQAEDYDKLINTLQNDIFVAHNANFDYKEVLNSVYNIEIKRRICTLKLARRLVPTLPKHSLQYLRYYFGLDFWERIDPHAALSDVIVLKWVFYKLFEIAKKVYPNKTDDEIIDAFIALEAQPCLLYSVEFWKYKWSKWSDVPKDYLDWIIKSNQFDEDIVYTAKHYL